MRRVADAIICYFVNGNITDTQLLNTSSTEFHKTITAMSRS